MALNASFYANILWNAMKLVAKRGWSWAKYFFSTCMLSHQIQ